MIDILHTLEEPNHWIKVLNKVIPSEIKDNVLTINKEAGIGTIKYIEIQKGLFITFIQAKFNNELYLKRTPTEENNHFIINFHLSKAEIKAKSKDKEYLLGVNNQSVLLESSSCPSELLVPAMVPLDIFNINFSREWFVNNINSDNDELLNSLINTSNPIYLFENIDPKFIKNILDIKSLENNLQKLSLFSNVLQTLDYFFSKIKERQFDKPITTNSDDLKSLMNVKREIEAQWTKKHSNEDLAKLANMSLSKFKRLFNQVFGTSPYQYGLTYKIDKAKEILEENKCTVSEIGYMIGYTNLSQFSKAFKKRHSILPSHVNLNF